MSDVQNETGGVRLAANIVPIPNTGTGQVTCWLRSDEHDILAISIWSKARTAKLHSETFDDGSRELELLLPHPVPGTFLPIIAEVMTRSGTVVAELLPLETVVTCEVGKSLGLDMCADCLRLIEEFHAARARGTVACLEIKRAKSNRDQFAAAAATALAAGVALAIAAAAATASVFGIPLGVVLGVAAAAFFAAFATFTAIAAYWAIELGESRDRFDQAVHDSISAAEKVRRRCCRHCLEGQVFDPPTCDAY